MDFEGRQLSAWLPLLASGEGMEVQMNENATGTAPDDFQNMYSPEKSSFAMFCAP